MKRELKRRYVKPSLNERNNNNLVERRLVDTLGKYADENNAVDVNAMTKNERRKLYTNACKKKLTRQDYVMKISPFHLKTHVFSVEDYIAKTRKIMDRTYRANGETGCIVLDKFRSNRNLYERIMRIKLLINDETTQTLGDTIANHFEGYSYTPKRGRPFKIDNDLALCDPFC